MDQPTSNEMDSAAGGDRSPSNSGNSPPLATDNSDRKYPPPASPSAAVVTDSALSTDSAAATAAGAGGATPASPVIDAGGAAALSAALLTASTASDAVLTSYELHGPPAATIVPVTDSAASRRRATAAADAYGGTGDEEDEPSPFVDDGMGTYRGRPTKNVYRSSCGAKMDRRLPHFFGKPMLWAFSRNFWAGVSVSMINVPMSIALAIASSCPPVFGVVTAFWAGLIGSICGGSHFNILGPSGALSGVIGSYARQYGADSIPYLSMTAGAMLILIFSLNWHRYVVFLPAFVTHGFTLGVAATIVGGQIADALGLIGLTEHADFLTNVWEQLSHVGQASIPAAILFLSSWLVLFVMTIFFPRLPWTVVVAAIGIILGYCSDKLLLGSATPVFHTLGARYGETGLSPDLFNFARTPNPAPFWGVLSNSASVTFVVILETMISGKIADRLSTPPSEMNERREVFGLGVANFICGVCGTAPASAFLGRMQIFIRSGGHNRVGAFVQSLITLLLVVMVFPVFSYLPLPTVAALLIQVAVSMVEHRAIAKFLALDRVTFALTLLVAVVSCVWDPTYGIVVGAVLGLLRFAESVSDGQSELTVRRGDDALLIIQGEKLDHAQNISVESLGVCSRATCNAVFAEPTDRAMGVAALDDEEERAFRVAAAAARAVQAAALAAAAATAKAAAAGAAKHDDVMLDVAAESSTNDNAGASGAFGAADSLMEGSILIYRIVGKLAYINLHHHQKRIKKLAQQGGTFVIFSFQYLYSIDVDGVDALETIDTDLRARGKHLILCDVQPVLWPLLFRSEWFRSKKAEKLILGTCDAAIRYARTEMRRAASNAAEAAAAEAEASPLLVEIAPAHGSDDDEHTAHHPTATATAAARRDDKKQSQSASAAAFKAPEHGSALALASAAGRHTPPTRSRSNSIEKKLAAAAIAAAAGASPAPAPAPSSVILELSPLPAPGATSSSRKSNAAADTDSAAGVSLDSLMGGGGGGGGDGTRTRRQQILWEKQQAAAAAAAGGGATSTTADSSSLSLAGMRFDQPTTTAASGTPSNPLGNGSAAGTSTGRSRPKPSGGQPTLTAPRESDEFGSTADD